MLKINFKIKIYYFNIFINKNTLKNKKKPTQYKTPANKRERNRPAKLNHSQCQSSIKRPNPTIRP
jgi:hypothetical protein